MLCYYKSCIASCIDDGLLFGVGCVETYQTGRFGLGQQGVEGLDRSYPCLTLRDLCYFAASDQRSVSETRQEG